MNKLYRISYSIIVKPNEDEHPKIGQGDIHIENLSKKLKNCGKCIRRQLFGFCYLDSGDVFYSISKHYEIKKHG